jgi:anaphase-promoting complex subunit 3
MSLDTLMVLLKGCAEAEAALTRYDSGAVLRCLAELPLGMAQTGWFMEMHGRAYFEQANYHMAAEWFGRCREKAEYHLKGLELYSTALWHLHREMELSALAQDLTQRFRHSAESWCAAGNCFSLQKDNDTAVRFLERAIQLKPTFAYPYTLLGSEYLELDQVEKARQCFRTAIRHQPRSYYAWFGIGSVYCKLGKLELAERYYRKALRINQVNPVLMCHVSVMLQRQSKSTESLALLERALQLHPSHALCLYQKAETLFALSKYDQCRETVERLKQLVPKEPKVYLLAGKVHKKLNQQHLALMNLSWATDLDPRGGAPPVSQPVAASTPAYERPPVDQLVAPLPAEIDAVEAAQL